MASQTKSPGTVADDATVGTIAWSNPDNAKVSDNSYATSTTAGTITHFLKATNFGFSVPAGAIINGIMVEFERKKDSFALDTTHDETIKIIKSDGTLGSTNKATSTVWSKTESYVPLGSSSDLWDETWTATDVNDTDFGVVISAHGTNVDGGNTVYVDHIRITVYYTEATPPTPYSFLPE